MLSNIGKDLLLIEEKNRLGNSCMNWNLQGIGKLRTNYRMFCKYDLWCLGKFLMDKWSDTAQGLLVFGGKIRLNNSDKKRRFQEIDK